MKKTINISLGKINFSAEEDAYQKLDQYLKTLSGHFNTYPGGSEIIEDIESRLAEQFAAKAVNKIITLQMVEAEIKNMGSPEELNAANTTSQNTASQENLNRKMYRNPDDIIIAGVASGIAAYFGVDSVWVRLGFILLTLGSGFGIILYIALWLILPEAKTDTQKMQMRGQPVNLKNVEAVVKERVEEFKKKDSSKVKRVLAAPIYALGSLLRALANLIKKLVPIFFRVIGALLSIASCMAMAFLFLIFISLLVNVNSPYLDFPLSSIAFGTTYYLAVISAFFVIFVPLILIIMLGASLATLRFILTKFAGFSLVALWIIALALSANLGLKLAPQIENIYKNDQKFKTESRTLNLQDFNSVEINSASVATITKGESFKVIVKGRQNDLDQLSAGVENQTLVLNQNSGVKFCLFCFKKPLEFEIQMPALQNIKAEGASKVNAFGFTQNDFTVKLSGASRINLDAIVNNLNAKLSGASRLTFSGEINNLNIDASGASQSDFSQMKTNIDSVYIKLSGASRAYLFTANLLNVQASGASSVYFFSAKQIENKLSGSSKLVPNYSGNNLDRLEIPEPDANMNWDENQNPPTPETPTTTTPKIKGI
jgi:phage shock protein PspC (stress-responsive transcriptional regulator)